MKKALITTIVLLLVSFGRILSQPSNDTLVYLLTIGPGTETYSIYGHSALLVKISSVKPDLVFNWGIFDFNTKNFAWKFAKGRLDYYLGVQTLDGFLQDYFLEKRYVYSQRINLTAGETAILIDLIKENLKPENKKYRYDFFYDDCSTRIRDLLEKSTGNKLRYPPDDSDDLPTFRELVGKYQAPYQWLNTGINLIMGKSADKEAGVRDRMFLPVDMMEGLSGTTINRSGKMIPLLQNPEVLVDFESPDLKPDFLSSPAIVLTLVIVLMLIMAALTKSRKIIRLLDISMYSVFSILSLLMIFFNFFTDHQQMRWNLNIIWLNPFILICLFMLILNKPGIIWFRIVFYISAFFIVVQSILPQEFDVAFILLTVMLLIRSSVRGDFAWNPLSISNPERGNPGKDQENENQMRRPRKSRRINIFQIKD
jgi:hypothetical protein